LRPNWKLHRRPSIGPVLLQELTIWRTAAKVNALLRAADDERRQAKAHRARQRARGRGEGLASLKVQMAAVEGKHRTVEADMGPIRYLAILLGAADEDVLRWFILVVALLLDPAAVLLLLAAASVRRA
jgi:hypothetical protein